MSVDPDVVAAQCSGTWRLRLVQFGAGSALLALCLLALFMTTRATRQHRQDSLESVNEFSAQPPDSREFFPKASPSAETAVLPGSGGGLPEILPFRGSELLDLDDTSGAIAEVFADAADGENLTLSTVARAFDLPSESASRIAQTASGSGAFGGGSGGGFGGRAPGATANAGNGSGRSEARAGGGGGAGGGAAAGGGGGTGGAGSGKARNARGGATNCAAGGSDHGCSSDNSEAIASSGDGSAESSPTAPPGTFTPPDTGDPGHSSGPSPGDGSGYTFLPNGSLGGKDDDSRVSLNPTGPGTGSGPNDQFAPNGAPGISGHDPHSPPRSPFRGSTTLTLSGLDFRDLSHSGGNGPYSGAGRSPAPVPEPASLVLLGAGLALMARTLKRSAESRRVPERAAEEELKSRPQ